MSEIIVAPMPGKVIKILVNVGDQVKEDDEIMILEAMKMENSIFCTATGPIQEIRIKEGDSVNTDQALFVLG
ncbi:MAG: 2-oxoglutarate carboxylase large subunit [Smithella sp. PtaU1.Bin162]|nr:MAG: 2-oxoglutarate carboxylase large subunit [Smithella sp. PtaU1.Bin162]